MYNKAGKPPLSDLLTLNTNYELSNLHFQPLFSIRPSRHRSSASSLSSQHAFHLHSPCPPSPRPRNPLQPSSRTHLLQHTFWLRNLPIYLLLLRLLRCGLLPRRRLQSMLRHPILQHLLRLRYLQVHQLQLQRLLHRRRMPRLLLHPMLRSRLVI